MFVKKYINGLNRIHGTNVFISLYAKTTLLVYAIAIFLFIYNTSCIRTCTYSELNYGRFNILKTVNSAPKTKIIQDKRQAILEV